MLPPEREKDKKSTVCYYSFMFQITGLDFTVSPELFASLQNRGIELNLSAGRRLMHRLRFPFVLIVTCDRAEVVAEGHVPPETLERALQLNPLSVSHCRYSFEDDGTHLFLLSSGIISPLFGEDTIQGQLREGAEAAALIGSSSSHLDKLFNMSVAFSKRIHTQYKVRVFDKTVIEEVKRQCEGKRDVLVIGSGMLARETASCLVQNHTVKMTLRDVNKTFLIPPSVIPVSYERRVEEALDADVIISASSGLYHTLTLEDLEKLDGKLIFDLSSPPDIPDASGVIRIADLEVEEPEKERMISIVEKEAKEEVASYHSWLEKASSMDDITVTAEDVAYETLRRLSSVISSLQLDDKKENGLRLSIVDSVRKSYIAKVLQKRKG